MESTNREKKSLILQVKDLKNNNSKSGFIFVNKADIRLLGCKEKDLVRLSGTRNTVAQVMISADCKHGMIQMDDIMMHNAGIGPDENVSADKTQSINAEHVFLVPFDNTKKLLQKQSSSSSLFGSIFEKIKEEKKRYQNEDIRQYQNLIEGIPITEGDWIRVPLFGRSFEFVISETSPKGNVIFTHDTQISVEGGLVIRAKNIGLSYDDIGGLKKEISRVREMVEVPMRWPQLFDKVGVAPPRGLLLYGPPGCGKTLIARAVAMEAGVYFISVNGPEIIKQHYGESEGKLR
ncbi:MAG: AAA family ATPase, partial [Porphyromonadaceae bacterium]|nr:AAA family ATPase [Porphyromonadaceae bacterium]